MQKLRRSLFDSDVFISPKDVRLSSSYRLENREVILICQCPEGVTMESSRLRRDSRTSFYLEKFSSSEFPYFSPYFIAM